MNNFAAWIDTPFAQALGWTLLHFIWQGAALALLLELLFLPRLAGARARYAVACSALLGMLLSFAVTLAIELPRQPVVPAVPVGIRMVPASAIMTPAPTVQLTEPELTAPRLLDRMPWLVPLWMLGVLGFYIRGSAGWLAASRLRRRGVCAVPPVWQQRLDSLRIGMRISRPVVLLESCLVDGPFLIGCLRPVVLLPLGCLTGLSAGQLECILIHELAHIRRHDYLLNVLQSAVEGLLFYHPAVWWVGRTVRAERENCCDDMVVSLAGDARVYAATLAELEHRRSSPPRAVLAATGGNLLRRIRRLLGSAESTPNSAGSAVSAGLLLVVSAAALAAWPAKPATQQRPRTLPAEVGIVLQTPVPKRILVVPDPLLAVEPAPQPAAQAMTPEQRRAQEKALRQALATPYRKWLNEDVAYIITDEERAAFIRMQTDQERERFIENFWLHRDPTSGTVENEFKTEHYRRIAYANEHYSSAIPGWKTDRGRIYISYGPADEVEDHAAGTNDPSTFPFQRWRYRYIEGVGSNVIIEFVDSTRSGEFHMTTDPSEKNALLQKADAGLLASLTKPAPRPDLTAKVFTSTDKPAISVMVGGNAARDGQTMALTRRITVVGTLDSMGGPYQVSGQVTALRTGAPQAFRLSGAGQPAFATFLALPTGTYRLVVTIKYTGTGVTASSEVNFQID